MSGRIGVQMNSINPAVWASNNEIHTLIIHAQGDTKVPISHAQCLLAACKINNCMLLIPQANHARCYKTDPTRYVSALCSFFESVEAKK